MKQVFKQAMILFIAVFSLPIYGQWSQEGIKLMEVMDKVSRYYVDSLDESDFVEETIVNMLHELDPHSSYISKEELKEISEQMSGEFEGIGVSFNILNDTIYIVNTIQGGPSEQVGILAGDRIVEVDNELVAGIGITTGGVQKRLKGKKGTKVDVKIFRKNTGQNIDFTIIRDKIPVYSLDASYMVNENVGYIKLSRFSQTTATEFERALIELKKQGLENLVLDLSGNGGGYLRIAVELADHFLSSDKRIVYTKGDKVPRRDYTSTSFGMFEEGRLVIMIDENSASASEIVSGAVQEWDRAVIVGRRSFGKGLVQQPFRLNDGSEMRLTIARYYTPSGRLIQKPYENGYEDYAMDLINRYNTGELNTTDSIHFPESQRYKTLIKGRAIFGGGGIMPDYFVPIDTSGFSNYYRDIFNRGIFNQFVLRFMDENGDKLSKKYSDFNSFKEEYVVSKKTMDALISFAEQEGLTYIEDDWNISKDKIALLLKAYVARDLWEISNFYEIYNESDPIYKKAIQILDDPSFYSEKL